MKKKRQTVHGPLSAHNLGLPVQPSGRSSKLVGPYHECAARRDHVVTTHHRRTVVQPVRLTDGLLADKVDQGGGWGVSLSSSLVVGHGSRRGELTPWAARRVRGRVMVDGWHSSASSGLRWPVTTFGSSCNT
jgi:hypothetical protein